MDSRDQRWYDALKAKGHVPKMDPWDEGDNNTLDTWVMSYDIHNGPGCTVCHYSACMYCDDPNKIPACEAIGKRQFMVNSWVTERMFEIRGYQKFTRQRKLDIINEWRNLKGKNPL